MAPGDVDGSPDIEGWLDIDGIPDIDGICDIEGWFDVDGICDIVSVGDGLLGTCDAGPADVAALPVQAANTVAAAAVLKINRIFTGVVS
jgi:hypothetical protein